MDYKATLQALVETGNPLGNQSAIELLVELIELKTGERIEPVSLVDYPEPEEVESDEEPVQEDEGEQEAPETDDGLGEFGV